MRVKTLDKRSVVALALFFTPFTIFLATICPNMYWRDAPEFQTVAYQLGIAHPAGSPFYAPLGKLFTFLPFGSIAFKVNLASAFFGALLVLLTFLLITECLELIFPSKNNGLFILSGAIAVAFYAVSHSLWHNSIMAEVYTLQNCFIVLIALCLIRGLRGTEKKSFLCLAGFLFGLSTGAHIIMILYIPSLILFLWLFYRKFLFPTQLGIIVMFIILGSSVYLYLPLRSSVDPYYDWGNPENVENFITHVTDRKDAKRHFFFSPEQFIKKLKKYGQYYVEEFNILGIILGLTGIGIFLRKKPKLFLGLGAFFFSQWFFFIRYWPWSSAFIGTFLFFTVGIGISITWIIEKLKELNAIDARWKSRIIPGALITTCGLQIFLTGCYHYQVASRPAYWSPYLFFRHLYDQTDFKGVLANTNYFFGLSYTQQCENYRPDVTNLNLSEILYPQKFSPVSKARYPLIHIRKVNAASQLEIPIIKENLKNHRFYWEPRWDRIQSVKRNLIPEGFVLSYSSSPVVIKPGMKRSHIEKIKMFFSENAAVISQYNDPEEIAFYSFMIENLGAFFYDLKDYSFCIEHLLMAHDLTPRKTKVLNGLAASYVRLSRHNKAEEYVKKALSIEPSNLASLQILGGIYLKSEKYEAARLSYQEILQKDSQNRRAHFGIGVCFAKIGEIHRARKAFQKVITLGKDDHLAQQSRRKLFQLKKSSTSDKNES